MVRVICFAGVIAVAIYTAAVVERAVASGDGGSGTFWGAVGLLAAIVALCAYAAVRLGAQLGIDRRRLEGSVLWRHGWKLGLVPLLLDVPIFVKYVCGTILAASLAIDLALAWSARRRLT